MTDAELTPKELQVVEAYRRLAAAGGPEKVWLVDRKMELEIRNAAITQAARVIQRHGCNTEACGHKACIALEAAEKDVWALLKRSSPCQTQCA